MACHADVSCVAESPDVIVIARSSMKQLLGLFVCLALVFLAAAAGGLASASAGSFFMELDRPLWRLRHGCLVRHGRSSTFSWELRRGLYGEKGAFLMPAQR